MIREVLESSYNENIYFYNNLHIYNKFCLWTLFGFKIAVEINFKVFLIIGMFAMSKL